MIKLTEILTEETPMYKDWDEFVNPHHIIVHLKNGKKIKVDRSRVRGGNAAYHAILKAFNDNNYKITNKIVKAMMDNLGEGVNEVFVKGVTYGGTVCKGGCFMGKEGLKKIIKISKESPNNVFMFRDDNYSGLQPHFIKNGVIAKANTIGNPSYDLERHKVRNLNIGKDVILSVRLFEGVNESIKEAKSDYEVYHKSYTSAINTARTYAEKKGYEINDDDAFRQIGMGPRKPSEGKTNKFSIELSKDGKVQRKKLQIQVYGMRNSYELNAYIQ